MSALTVIALALAIYVPLALVSYLVARWMGPSWPWSYTPPVRPRKPKI